MFGQISLIIQDFTHYIGIWTYHNPRCVGH